MRKVWVLLVVIGVVASLEAGAAQKPPAPPAAPVGPAATNPDRQAPPPPPAAPTPDGRLPRVGPNVRVDVTLSDMGGAGAAPTTKAVTITTNDNSWGKLRAAVTSRAYGVAPLNIDALPIVLSDGRVRLSLTIEYNQGRNPDVEGNTDRITGVAINQSTTIVLESGKSQQISQSADPIGDRKVSLEVKATILKN
jgi:hypothetical protein